MVSARRAARAGLDRAPTETSGVPEWVWGDEFQMRQWVRDHGGLIEGRYEAYVEWRDRCRRWLEEHGLVMWGVNVSYEEFKRIERAEPHRALRRPT